MPFVYRAKVKAALGRRTRAVEDGYLDTVPVHPIEVATADLRLAIRVTRISGIQGEEDQIVDFRGQLYRRLSARGSPVPASVLHREATDPQRRAIHNAVSNLPRPAGSMAPRYGISANWSPSRLEDAAKREGWAIVAVTSSDHSARWNEASVFYHDAVLVCGDALYVRCREPAWRYSHRHVVYQTARVADMAHDQFGFDRAAELQRFVGETTHMRWGEIVVDPIATCCDWQSDDLAVLIDLGRQAMALVPYFRQVTTAADRRARGCEQSLTELEALYRRHGEFGGDDARRAIDAVGDLAARLGEAMRLRWVAGAFASQMPRIRARLKYLDERLNELSEQDRDALIGL